MYCQNLKTLSKNKIFILVFSGLIFTWFKKGFLTRLMFAGKIFEGRSLAIRFGLFIGYSITIIFLILLFFILLVWFFPQQSNKLDKFFDWAGEKILLLGGVLWVLFPTNPFNMPFPVSLRDSGVFLYVGWRILNGELPYRDVWDHKPPIIFYIDALGSAISNNSRWGIWIIEVLSLFMAVLIGYKLIQKNFGRSVAFFASFLWLMTLVFVLQGGNLTEEFALPFQFLCLWLAHDIEKCKFPLKRLFLIGLVIGISFFIKQTTIGIGTAIISYLIIRGFFAKRVKELIRELVFLSSGCISVFIIIATFFAVQNAFQPFFNAVFTYNFIYASSVTGFVNRLKPLITGIKPLTTTGLFQVALSGYVYSVYLFLFKKHSLDKWNPLLAIGLIALPIEFFMVGLSGRTHPHYYISMIPVLSLFAGISFWGVYSQLLSSDWKKPIYADAVFTICVIGVFFWSSFWAYKDQYVDYSGKNDDIVIRYIRAKTTPNDAVLFWGAESSVNYFSQRRSPTQYVYQYPLYKEGYVTEKMIVDYLETIIQEKPRLILDTHNPVTPFLFFPIKSKAINEQIDYLQLHYHPVECVNTWVVYEYVGN